MVILTQPPLVILTQPKAAKNLRSVARPPLDTESPGIKGEPGFTTHALGLTIG